MNYKHQDEGLDWIKDRDAGAIFWEQGLGKTRLILQEFRRSQHRVLIVMAPSGVHLNWIHVEFGKIDIPNTSAWAWGSKTKQADLKTLARFFTSLMEVPEQRLMLAFNIEAARVDEVQQAIGAFLAKFDSMLVVDESTCIKNHQAKQTRAMIALGKHAKRKFILTGTPMTKNPLDLWGQFSFLNPREPVPGFNLVTPFKATFLDTVTMTTASNARYEIVKGVKNLDTLAKLIGPMSLRRTKEECLDLPDKIITHELIPLPEEVRKHYDRMVEQCLTLIKGNIVTAATAATLLIKLRQITSGYAKTDDGFLVTLPDEKVARMITHIEDGDPDEKYVIWTHFTEPLKRIADALNRAFGDGSAVTYFGETDNEARLKAEREFNDPKSGVRFFVANRTASRGLTLVSACRAIYHCQDFSYEDWAQSQDRIHRIGQTRTTFYTVLQYADTVDQTVAAILERKGRAADTLLSQVQDLPAQDWAELFRGRIPQALDRISDSVPEGTLGFQ